MQRIAIPVADGRLSAHFGHAPFFYVYQLENNKIIREEMLTPLPHEQGSIPRWLIEIQATDIIVGGIGAKAIEILNSHEINVFSGAPALSPKDIIDRFLSGTLKTTDNTCNHGDSHKCVH